MKKWLIGLSALVCLAFVFPPVTQQALTIFTGGIQSDTIAEVTPAAGVTIDGTLLKDGVLGGKTVANILETSHIRSTEHQPGFIDNTNLSFTIDQANRTFTLTPTSGTIQFVSNGILKSYATPQVSTPFDDTVGTKYVYFDTSGTLIVSPSQWTLKVAIAPIMTFYWNGALAEGSRVVARCVETHPNTWPLNVWRAHHVEEGSSWDSGLVLYYTTSLSAPNASGINTCVGLSGGGICDESLCHTFTNGTGGASFEQDLGVNVSASVTVANGLLAEIQYKNASSTITRLPATRFPFHWGSGTNRPQYVNSSGAITEVGDNTFMVNWVCAVGDDRTGKSVFIIPHYVTFASLSTAQAATWYQLTSTVSPFSSSEVKPLYQLIHRVDHTGGSAYGAAVKYAGLQSVIDLRPRGTAVTASGAFNASASGTSLTPYLTITGTNVQDGVEQLKDEVNLKAGTSVATTSANGLMSSTDKTKLDTYASTTSYTTTDNNKPVIFSSGETWAAHCKGHLHFEGVDGSTTFTDSSSLARTFSGAGSLQVDTAQYKFGSASGLFNGTTDYLYAADSADWDFGVGGTPFTFETRIKTTNPALMCILARGGTQASWSDMTNGIQYILQYQQNTGRVHLYYNKNGSNSEASCAAGAFTDGNWHTVGVAYNGTTVKVFFDGTVGNVTSTDGFYKPTASDKFYLGNYAAGGGYYNGWMDETIFINGACLWTTTYTPSTTAYLGALSTFKPLTLTASKYVKTDASSGLTVAATDPVLPGSLTTSGLTMNTARLVGRTTGSAGATEEITVGTGLSLSGGALTSTVTVPTEVVENLFVNSDFTIDQINSFATVTCDSVTFKSSGDQWRVIGEATDGVYEATVQTAVVPTGYTNALKVQVKTADASIDADQRYLVIQDIEGYNFARLKWGTADAKALSVKFWVRCSVTGIYTASFTNLSVNRNYLSQFTIAQADTWQQVSLTIPGDTTGTWNAVNSIGCIFTINLGCGSNLRAAKDTWAATYYYGSTGDTNLIATDESTMYLGGFEAGEVGALVLKENYERNLTRCKRYYQIYGKETTDSAIWEYDYNGGTSTVGRIFTLPVEMRSKPTATKIGTWSVTTITENTITVTGMSKNTFRIYYTGTNDRNGYYTDDENDYVTLDSRL